MRLWTERPRTRGEWIRLIKRVVLIGGGLGFLYLAFLYFTLPNISDARTLLASQSTVITDRNGVELYRLFQEEDRTTVEGTLIPLHAKRAVIAIEDERYYERGCLDMRAIGRVIFRLGQAGGASTITRQLARNALDLSRENIISRKLKELILGCQMEWTYEKEELLELYLNWIPFGHNAYGIEQASRSYFGTSASGLTLAQSAVLASLPQRPSYFSPYGRHLRTAVSEEIKAEIIAGEITSASQISGDDVRIGLLGGHAGTGTTIVYVGGRTDQVLRNMQDLGFITEQERLQALNELETMTFQPSRQNIRAPHFVLAVREQVEQILGERMEEGILERKGFIVQTTLDWELQKAAETVIAFHREDALKRFGIANVSLVAMEPATREVLAYVGNTDYSKDVAGGQIDMALAPRQPGSSFKPFVYAAAFRNGYGPATVLYDVPTKIGEDSPQNFDGTHGGIMTARTALAGSRNIPAAKMYFLAGGEEEILSLVEVMGAPSPRASKETLPTSNGESFEYGWPLALGAAETPLIEMVQGYATLANGGRARPVVTIRTITDERGNIVYAAEEEESVQVLDPRIAYQITSILSDVQARPGEYWQNVLSVPGTQAAVKTGTSNKCLKRDGAGNCTDRKPSDLWTLGYTPSLVAGVWMGNADSSALDARAESLSIASPIWKDFMTRAQRILPNQKTAFSVPDRIMQPQVSLLSGNLPAECTPVELRRPDVFLVERAPSEPDTACVRLLVDKVTGLLASDACPVDAREERDFLVASSLLPNRWPAWQQGVDQWVTVQMEKWNAAENHSGSLLPLPVAPTEECDPSLTPGRLQKPTIQILSPPEGGSANYPSFRPKIDFTVGSTVREVQYMIDGKPAGTATAEPFDMALRVPRSVAESGMHTLTVQLTDEYYNVARAEVKFQFQEDNTPPEVRILSPQDGTTLKPGEKLVLRADAFDDEGGIKYVQFYLQGRLLSNDPLPPYELTYPDQISPGTYTVRAKATDMADNTAEDEVEVEIE